MKREKAKEMICPYNSNSCVVDKCMFWIITENGKKEVDRKIIPYDLYPREESDWRRNMKDKGYIDIGRQHGGFRDTFIKYEESFEGYCSHKEKEISK